MHLSAIYLSAISLYTSVSIPLFTILLWDRANWSMCARWSYIYIC